jgi:hypothetical protein
MHLKMNRLQWRQHGQNMQPHMQPTMKIANMVMSSNPMLITVPDASGRRSRAVWRFPTIG